MNAHPLVTDLFEIMNNQNMPPNDLATRAGICPQTIYGWRIKTNPTVPNLEACLNVLGYRLEIVRKFDGD